MNQISLTKELVDFPSKKRLTRHASCPVICLISPEIEKSLTNPGGSFKLLKNDFAKNASTNSLTVKEIIKKNCEVQEEGNSTVVKLEPERPQQSHTLKNPTKSGQLMNRFRRFSEMNASFRKSFSNHNNGRYSSDTSNINFSTKLNSNSTLFRRHTQKIFKHGKTARTLGKHFEPLESLS